MDDAPRLHYGHVEFGKSEFSLFKGSGFRLLQFPKSIVITETAERFLCYIFNHFR